MALAGVGKKVRLYDLGKRKLLAKCENRVSLCFSFFFVIFLFALREKYVYRDLTFGDYVSRELWNSVFVKSVLIFLRSFEKRVDTWKLAEKSTDQL